MQTSNGLKTRYVEQNAEPDYEEYQDNSSIDWENVRKNVELLSSRCRFLLQCTMAGIALSLLTAYLLPVTYKSTVVLMPPDSTSISPLSLIMGMGEEANMKGGAGGNAALGAVSELLGAKSPGQLYVRAISTNIVEDRMIDRFNLMDVYEKKLRVDARKRLESFTSATEDKRSGVISIDVEDHDPKRAADMANAYVGELNTLLIGISTSTAGRERDYLAQHLVQAKRDLDVSAAALGEFSSKNATIDPEEQSRALVDAGAQLEGQLIAAETDLRGMQQLYTDKNIRVQQLKSRIIELQRQIRKLGGTDSTLKQQGTSNDDLYPPIRKLPLIGVPYMDLYRQVKVNEAVYTALVERYELENLEQGDNVAIIQVLDPADVPEKKCSPHRVIIILAGTLLFFAAGIGWIFIQNWWTNTNKDDPLRLLLEPGVNLFARIFGIHAEIS